MKINLREIIKLNLIYLVLQLLLYILLNFGLFNLFLENCFGSLLCNINFFLLLQVFLGISYLLFARRKFIQMNSTARFINIGLSLFVLFIIGNIFLYSIAYKPVKIQILLIFNIALLVSTVLASINYKVLFKNLKK